MVAERWQGTEHRVYHEGLQLTDPDEKLEDLTDEASLEVEVMSNPQGTMNVTHKFKVCR